MLELQLVGKMPKHAAEFLLLCHYYFDERIQQDILDHFIAFHKFKTLYAEGKFSTNTSESLQRTAFISLVDTYENPSLVDLDAFYSTVLAVQQHGSFDTEARAGTFLCLPRVPCVIWLLVMTLLFIVYVDRKNYWNSYKSQLNKR